MNDYRTPLASNHLIKNGTTEYTVLRVLGAGGTGYVYLCKQSNGAYVAIKELYPKELWHVLERQATGDLLFTGSLDSQKTLDWYRQTVKSAALLEQEHTKSSSGDNNSPYFMQCLQTPFEDHGTLYTVYNTFEGNSFGDYIKEKRKSLTNADFLSTILSVIIITCKKLSYLHQQGLLHMDISPWNIFVTNHGGLEDIPYLLDFGSAFKLGSDASHCRFSVTDGFTPAEIYRHATGVGRMPISAAADTYSLVAVLFYALTGKTYDDALWEMNNGWSKLLEDYPNHDDLCVIFRTGLNSQHQRYQSADGLMDALCEYRAQIRGNNKNDDLDLKLSELNKSFVTFQQKMFQQHQEFKNEINQKLDDLGLTENARINKFFRIIDCILSATTKDHKSVGNVKSVLLTRYTFLSMCAYEGSDKAIKAHIDKSPDFTSPDITAERLNQLFQEKGRKDPFYAAFCKRYRFETSKEDIISVCRLSTNDWSPEVEDYFAAWDFLIGAYNNCNHNDYFGYLKREINRTVSEYMQCLVYMGFIIDTQSKKRYFDACKYLIDTHNHYPYYILSLFGGKNYLGEKQYFFSKTEDFEPIKSLAAMYLEDGFWTDMPSVRIGKQYIAWLCYNDICSNGQLFDLIEKRNCFDEFVWERVLQAGGSDIRTYVMKHIFLKDLFEFEDETKRRRAIAFVLMLGNSKTLSENLVKTEYASEEKNEYNKAFTRFYKLFELFLDGKAAKSDPLTTNRKRQIQHAQKRITAKLFQKSKESGRSQENSQDLSDTTKEFHKEDALSRILKLGILRQENDTFSIGTKLRLDYSNATAAEFFSCFEQICRTAGLDDTSKSIYNLCYQVVLESANESGLNKLVLSYCKYLAYSNSYTSEQNKALACDTISAFLCQTTEKTYYVFNEKCVRNMAFLLSGCRGDWIYRKLFLDLYESTGGGYSDIKYEILGWLLYTRVINIYTLLNYLKAERENEGGAYSRCLGQLLGGKLNHSWRVAHIMPIIRLLLQSDNFDALSPKTQESIAKFVARRLPSYVAELSADLRLGTALISKLQVIPDSMEPVCRSMLAILENEPMAIKYEWNAETIDFIGLAEKLLYFYRNNPQQTAILAARAASILQGTIMARLGTRSFNHNLLSIRKKSYVAIMSHPCIRGLAQHYANQLYKAIDYCNEHILRTESDDGDKALLQLIDQLRNRIFPEQYYGNDVKKRFGLFGSFTKLSKTIVCPGEIVYPQLGLRSHKKDEAEQTIYRWHKQAKPAEVFEPEDGDAVIVYKKNGKLYCIDGKHLIWACENNANAPKKIVAYLWEPERMTVHSKPHIRSDVKQRSARDLHDLYKQLKVLDGAGKTEEDNKRISYLIKGYEQLKDSLVYKMVDRYPEAFEDYANQIEKMIKEVNT